ncbi:M16 family metallopeptidase [Sphingomonas quercus]|uniref:Insulinase family protein n=1 Tax=Sphingomonas quercus TaxID=2842451 RepID=A0ABS6BFJ2_9SPHN|nr:pitrilysin family protein [Sphingomonas quercus]MBU3077048.1 insulinase family protein [Sphingomonas quercus]
MVRLPFAALALAFLAAPVVVPAAPIGAGAPVPVATLLRQVDIPWDSFTLPNGLKVIVHTDRKAPIVAVSVWYHVGSKDEPKGETGFAHLFEHLMFGGSENAAGGLDNVLLPYGATQPNGSTSFDRTNYFETVPTPVLPLALFLESDRMGHLLGAVTQQKLDAQRGVVQNEKRQGDNEPFGLVDYAQLEALFPAGHPYHHSTIGSMADLDAASLDTVKNWFRQRYGPNNAVLVLAGDIDVATARPLVERYFGDIPKGPDVAPAAASVPTLPARKELAMQDRVATTRLYRSWAVPGLNDADAVPLDVGATVLGGLASSRLDNILVRDEKLAVAVSADMAPLERVGLYSVVVDVRPGVDPQIVSKRLDQIIADFLAKGPTADEVQRVATRMVAARLGGLEQVGGFGGKAVTLAEGQLYSGDPDFYKKQLALYAAATPASVTAATRKWLSRPVLAITVSPGDRSAYDEARAAAPAAKPAAASEARPAAPQNPAEPARKAPVPGEIADLVFPKVERARLSNGVEIVYAHRDAVPLTRISLGFDAGNAADPHAALGTQSLMLSLLDEGTTTRNSVQIAEAEERLGADIGAAPSMDRTSIGLSALSANLKPSLDLFADIVRNPAFAPAEVNRLRAAQLARIDAEASDPGGIAARAIGPVLFGPDHPYGVPLSGTGDKAVVARLTPAELRAFHQAWLRPDKARFFVVSDLPLAQIKAALEESFGNWRPPASAAGAKAFKAPTPPRPRIILIDRPGSPQSYILAGSLLPLPAGGAGVEDLQSANDILGGSFLSRLNSDLRESKGWAYGVASRIRRLGEAMPFLVTAPVQADRTGDSIKAILDDTRGFLTTNGVTPEERDRTVQGQIRELPGTFETGGAVLEAMRANDLYGRPDDYQSRLPAIYRAQTVAHLDAAARATIDPAKLVWIVVGDAAKVRTQLDGLGLPVETMPAK